MDITIGVQQVNREILVESDQTPEEVSALVAEALSGKPVLELVDTHGRRVLVSSSSIGYVEIGVETRPRVGFGTL